MLKTFFCSALRKTQSVLVSTLRWFGEQRRRGGKTVRKVRRWVDVNDVTSFLELILLRLILTVRCKGVLGIVYQ